MLAGFLALAVLLAGCGRKNSERPRLTIAYSNDLHGEIRSCGCSSGDLGGLGRRATFLQALRDTTGDFLLVDAGDFFSSSINYGIEKADLTMKSMALMGYHGVVIGENELSFGTDFIVRRARETMLPVLVANLRDVAGDSLVFSSSRVVTMPSGLRVGLTGAMSQTVALPPQVPPGSLEILEPLAAVQPVVDALRRDADVVVVLAHMPRGDAQRFAESLNGVDVVMNGHDGKPVRQPRRFGGAYLLQQAARGLYMGVARVTLDPEGRVASIQDSAHPLDPRYPDQEAIAELFRAYDRDIADKERAVLPAGITGPRGSRTESYRGAEACRDCHESIYDAWAGTAHAHAWETLTGISRQLDRDCTPCHSTGFYETGGFQNEVTTPHLTGVQCEVCHGNGFAHAGDPGIRTGVDARSVCRDCHNEEQTPEFDFETFWKKIDHGPEGTAAGASKGR